MFTSTLSLAGLKIRVNTVYDDIFRWGKDFITAGEPDICVAVTEDDIAAEEQKSRAESAYEGIVYPEYAPQELEYTAVYRKIAQQLPAYDGFVFHGSAVAVGQQAYLFTAKSGTGKTTHTALWLKNIAGSYVVNGDKPILRFLDGVVYACGTPWMGKENFGNTDMVPLKSICYLNRGAKNEIRTVSFDEIFPVLLGQSYRPPQREMLAQTLHLLEKLGRQVSLYTLFCNMENEAALVSYSAMSK